MCQSQAEVNQQLFWGDIGIFVRMNFLIKEPSQDNVLELNELYLNAFPDNEMRKLLN